MKKIIGVCLVCLVLASCEVAPEGSTSSSGMTVLVEETVALPNGDKVDCVRYQSLGDKSAVSCDWVHRGVK